jgi:hypothetical protein
MVAKITITDTEQIRFFPGRRIEHFGDVRSTGPSACDSILLKRPFVLEGHED